MDFFSFACQASFLQPSEIIHKTHEYDISFHPIPSNKTNTDDKTKEAQIQVFVPANGESASGPMMIVSRSSTVSIPLSDDPPMDDTTLQAAWFFWFHISPFLKHFFLLILMKTAKQNKVLKRNLLTDSLKTNPSKCSTLSIYRFS